MLSVCCRSAPACGAHPTCGPISFIPLDNAWKDKSDSIGLSSLGEVRHALLDVAVGIRDLSHQPTHVSELTQQPLNYNGQSCNASASGAGTVWFGATAPIYRMSAAGVEASDKRSLGTGLMGLRLPPNGYRTVRRT